MAQAPQDRSSAPPDRPDVRPAQPRVAYFSMEIALENDLPTYSGGLGVLAGDTIRAAADLGVPLVAITLVHREGYFRQHLDERGDQTESPAHWTPEERLEEVDELVTLELEGRLVLIRAWRYDVRGVTGSLVPVYLLDTDLSENDPEDQSLTDRLYGGDERYRLRQEALLGMGGAALLRVLGHGKIHTFHMNEGHAAFLPVALLENRVGPNGLGRAKKRELDAVRSRCVFTTHTPVPAGHDRFRFDLVQQVLGKARCDALHQWAEDQGALNMTHLALHFSRFVNGVALRHAQVSRGMFPGRTIHAITNGVHVETWASPAMARLFDRHLGEWRLESDNLRHALTIPLEEVREAHDEAKAALFDEVRRREGVELDPAVFTLGFARRATTYKRSHLLFSDLDRLRELALENGGLQIVYGGKAHPRDEAGKATIRRVHEAAAALEGDVSVLYLEDYDMELGRLITAGVDLWVNTPEKPLEASGTSGMKSALNGVPSLSVLDGWWIEGHIEGVTGWSIGDDWESPSDMIAEAASLYDKLEQNILPLFYDDPDGMTEVRRSAIGFNGSFFTTRRMMMQYVNEAYGGWSGLIRQIGGGAGKAASAAV